MSHTEIIIILTTAGISSTLGVIAAINIINKHTRPPVNTLVRSGDIELVDFIEPTQPQQVYNYTDLLGQQFQSWWRISDYNGTLPSYWSGTPPSYQTTDRININCCLENSINLDFILLLLILFFILILIIIILIRKLLFYR